MNAKLENTNLKVKCFHYERANWKIFAGIENAAHNAEQFTMLQAHGTRTIHHSHSMHSQLIKEEYKGYQVMSSLEANNMSRRVFYPLISGEGKLHVTNTKSEVFSSVHYHRQNVCRYLAINSWLSAASPSQGYI